MSFYVYQYLDQNDVPFYIGKGTGRRVDFHLTGAKGGYLKNKLLENTINKMLREGFEPKPSIIATFDLEDDAYALEERLIKKHGRKLFEGGTLCNIDLGGRGGKAGFIHTEETRARMSRSKIGLKIKRTPEHNEKIRQAHLARHKKES